MHKFYTSKNFKGDIYEYKGILHCKGYDYEELLDEIMETPLSEPFFAKKLKMLSRPDGSMLYGKLGVDFFSTSVAIYPNMKVRLGLITATPTFEMISDNSNVSVGIVDCSLYLRRESSQGRLSQERMDVPA